MSNFENETHGGMGASSPLYCKREGRLAGIRAECGQDFVLPDYMGDVKRLLKYSARITPCNKFVSGGELSFLSVVTFRVAYLDSENMLTEACFTADYEHSERIAESFSDADIDTRVHGVTVRLGGPRKISAKAQLISDISLSGEELITERADFPGAEKKEKKIKIRGVDFLGVEEREYAEELERLEDISADEIEVVKYDAEAFIDSVHETDNGVNLSGYIDAFCILRAGDELIRVEKRLPVEENLAIEGAAEDSSYRASCYLTGVNLNVNPAPEDKDGNIFSSVVMNMMLECKVLRDYNGEYTVVTDAFFEGFENECAYESFSYNELIGSVTEKKKQSFVIKRGEENLGDIIDKEMTVKNVKYEVKDGEVTVTGDISACLIGRVSDTGECFAQKLEESLSEKVRLAGVSDSSRVRVSVTPCELSPSFDSEKIYIDTACLVTVVAEEPRTVKLLSSLERREKDGASERCVLVYYPEREETLWSVAKKYGVSPAKIARQNSLGVQAMEDDADISAASKIVIIN